MGLLQEADWKAKWISPGYAEDSLLRPSPLLRKKFPTQKFSLRQHSFMRMDCMKRISMAHVQMPIAPDGQAMEGLELPGL
jgi:hypothetical protein